MTDEERDLITSFPEIRISNEGCYVVFADGSAVDITLRAMQQMSYLRNKMMRYEELADDMSAIAGNKP